MFGLGMWELVLVLVVALMVLGPQRLPQLAKQVGRAMREFRRAANELQSSLDDSTAPPSSGPPAPVRVQAADDAVALGAGAAEDAKNGVKDPSIETRASSHDRTGEPVARDDAGHLESAGGERAEPEGKGRHP